MHRRRSRWAVRSPVQAMRRCVVWLVLGLLGAATALGLYWWSPSSRWVPMVGVLTALALTQAAGWSRWADGYRIGAGNVIRALHASRPAGD